MSTSIRADRLEPGHYLAHGTDHCEILTVEVTEDWVRVKFHYLGKICSEGTPRDRHWYVQRYWEARPYVINELTLI